MRQMAFRIGLVIGTGAAYTVMGVKTACDFVSIHRRLVIILLGATLMTRPLIDLIKGLLLLF